MFKEIMLNKQIGIQVLETEKQNEIEIETFDDTFWINDYIIDYFFGKKTRHEFDEWYCDVWNGKHFFKK